MREYDDVPPVGDLTEDQRGTGIVTERGAVVVDARIGVLAPRPAARPYDHMAIHPYPSGLRDSMELPGSVVATIRPIRPEDAAIESAFVHGLSDQSKFLRFMFGLRDLTPAMLSRFTQIDYDRELALIAVIDTTAPTVVSCPEDSTVECPAAPVFGLSLIHI